MLSCVVIGISISLLFAPTPANTQPLPNNYDSQWQGWTRDLGPYFDYDDLGFRVVPILGLVASALNFVVIAPL